MANLYKLFRDLLPPAPLLAGTVIGTEDGSVTIKLPGGGRLIARGEAQLDERVFVRDGVIEGIAPDLPFVEIEI